MSCLNMYNNDEQKGPYTSMGPRISFSNDFAGTQMAIKQEISKYRDAPVSSDFEFSVSNSTKNMRHADEILSKGTLLPFQDNNICTNQFQKMTLRDTLLAYDDNEDDSDRQSKNSGWWKERLGLKRVNVPKNFGRNGGDFRFTQRGNF